MNAETTINKKSNWIEAYNGYGRTSLININNFAIQLQIEDNKRKIVFKNLYIDDLSCGCDYYILFHSKEEALSEYNRIKTILGVK